MCVYPIDNTIFMLTEISQGEADYKALPADIPAIVLNNPTGGHMQTYMDENGGIIGTAAVAFYNWQLKGNATAKEFILGASGLKSLGWDITAKGSVYQ
jgi:hypothetical protein